MVDLKLVVVFPTTHLTLKAEQSLEKAGIGHRTIMKPRRISSDCGLAVRIGAQDLEISRGVLLKDGLVPARYFREEDSGWECILELSEE